MDMDSNKRRNIGILGSIGVHIVVFLVIAFTGLLHYSAHKEDIVEIAFFGGGGGGGGSGSEASVEEVVEEESAPEEEAAEEPQPEPDAIYQESKEAKPAAAHTPKRAQHRAAASKGSGTGHGSGTGSGVGPGSGSGSGGGHGSGQGTGIGSSVGPGSGGGISSAPAVPPRLVRSPQPVYPSAEKNAGIEGTVSLRLLVGYDGNVEEVTVRGSSGNANLDAAAVAACYKWRFTSAKNGSGQKIRCYINIPITFRIRN